MREWRILDAGNFDECDCERRGIDKAMTSVRVMNVLIDTKRMYHARQSNH